MKKILYFYSVLALAVFSVTFQSCGNKEKELEIRLQACNENAARLYADASQQLASARDSIKLVSGQAVETYKATQAKLVHNTMIRKMAFGVNGLNLSMIPTLRDTVIYVFDDINEDIKDFVPGISAIQNLESYSYNLNGGEEDARGWLDQLKSPAMLNEVWSKNKAGFAKVIEKLQVKALVSATFKDMAPFVEEKVSPAKAKTFQAFFDKYGQEEYGIPRDNDEWTSMLKDLKLGEEQLNNEYKMWLWTNRRKADGTLPTIKAIMSSLK